MQPPMRASSFQVFSREIRRASLVFESCDSGCRQAISDVNVTRVSSCPLPNQRYWYSSKVLVVQRARITSSNN